VSWQNIAACAVACAVLIVIPGPSVLFTIGRALSLGRRSALVSVIGNASGIAVQVIVIVLGLGALLAASLPAYTAVRVIGAGYLIWLGVQTIRRRDEQPVGPIAAPSTASVYRQGMLVGVTNPKSLVFLSALLPQFVTPSATPPGVQLAVLGGIFLALAVVLDSCWALAASQARNWFATSPKRLSRLRAAGGAMVIGLGVVTGLTRR
jgi:threonine/homoserine/homoserine lactone efflux protein